MEPGFFSGGTRLGWAARLAWRALTWVCDRTGRVGSAWLLPLVALKPLWGVWHRGLTSGDTAYYFGDAVRWVTTHQGDLVWSPLYTAYYGACYAALSHAGTATLVHRIGLIALTTALVALLAWRTLPRLWAWVLTLWWVALPIHYDTLYEVHLFGALPTLGLAWLSVSCPGRWRQPAMLGLALVAALFVRNEYLIVLGVLALWGVVGAWRQRGQQSAAALGLPWRAYGVVVLLVASLSGAFALTSAYDAPTLSGLAAAKHRYNMCQVYSFAYLQRHPDARLDPWSHCEQVMTRVFGQPLPSLTEMIAANPAAVREHFAWNLSLLPAGLELLLLNARADGPEPDYQPSSENGRWPHLALGGILLAGLWAGWHVRRGCDEGHQRARRLLVRVAPLGVALTLQAVAIVLTQRPRPSYLLGPAVVLVWVGLVCVDGAVGRPRWLHGAPVWGLALAAFLCLCPSYQALPLASRRSALGVLYDNTQPYAATLYRQCRKVALDAYGTELANYLFVPLAEAASGTRPRAPELLIIRSLPAAARTSPAALVQALADSGVEGAIVDPYLIDLNPALVAADSVRQAFAQAGWRCLGYRALDARRGVGAFVSSEPLALLPTQ